MPIPVRIPILKLKPKPKPNLQIFNILEMTATAGDDAARSGRSTTITQLPDEVLQHILVYCPPHDVLLNIQQLSRRFQRLTSEPLLLRHHCRVEFKYWDAKHQINQKFLGSVGEVDWRRLYIRRRKVDADTTKLLDSILECQTDRISRFKSISDFGYDAKDTLLRHCRTDGAAEDVLARRYESWLHGTVLIY